MNNITPLHFTRKTECPPTRTDVLTVHSHEGRQETSTLTANIASIVAQRGYKTLLVDLDLIPPHPTITCLFTLDSEPSCTSTDLLLGKKVFTHGSATNTAYPCLDVLPVDMHIDLGKDSRTLNDSLYPHILFRLNALIGKARKLGYRLLVFNCPPGHTRESLTAIGLSDTRVLSIHPTISAYEAAKHLLTTVYSPLAVDTTTFFLFHPVSAHRCIKEHVHLTSWIKTLQTVTPDIAFLGLLPSCVDHTAKVFVEDHDVRDELPLCINSSPHILLSDMVDTIIHDLNVRKCYL